MYMWCKLYTQLILRGLICESISQHDLIMTSLMNSVLYPCSEDLKLLCGQEFENRLAVDNAAEALIHADKYSIEPLKSACINFIAVHYSDVKETAGWAKCKERQAVYTKVLEVLCSKFRVPSAVVSADMSYPPAC